VNRDQRKQTSRKETYRNVRPGSLATSTGICPDKLFLSRRLTDSKYNSQYKIHLATLKKYFDINSQVI